MALGARSLPVLQNESAFDAALDRHGLSRLSRAALTTLQVNVGKHCNMACLHCHVEAGPTRTEMMTLETAERVMALLERTPSIRLVDFTGGAPELNPHFRFMVRRARQLGRRVIDRCNLSVLFEPGQEDTADFLAALGVEVVASLPCYSADNVEKQRGKGAFDKSVQALRQLNQLGYGRPGSALKLDLVYNPIGPSLPPSQASLEAKYRDELARLFGIDFHHLLTITNMPIKRFAHALEREGKLQGYERLLEANFNPAAVPAVMCRSLVSVAWDGRLFDCDFNQMLELPLSAGERRVWDMETFELLRDQPIATANHCFGCTAGAGSSCSGALS